VIRPYRPDDLDALLPIGEEWDLGEGPNEFGGDYLDLVQQLGTVLVATDGDRAVGFAGAVPVRGAAMITDLFVTASHHGRGLGGALLDALLAGQPRRMTCCSTHPSALPTYVSRGLQPRWHLRYLEGLAVDAPSPLSVVPVALDEWGDDRPERAAHWHRQGARLVALLDVRDDRVGHAVLLPEAAGWSIPQLVTSVDHGHAMAALLSSVEAGTPITTWVPEWSAAALVLDELDFLETDADLWCSTDSRLTSRAAAALHPGLG
jgi:GNAT superfamily N-acetyltransferase